MTRFVVLPKDVGETSYSPQIELPPPPAPGERERWEAEYDRLGAEAAYALLSGGNEADTVQTGTAKAEFLRRKAKIDETWDEKLRRSASMLFQRPVSSIGRDGIRTTCSSLSI